MRCYVDCTAMGASSLGALVSVVSVLAALARRVIVLCLGAFLSPATFAVILLLIFPQLLYVSFVPQPRSDSWTLDSLRFGDFPIAEPAHERSLAHTYLERRLRCGVSGLHICHYQ